MVTRWQGWLAAIVVTLVTVTLVILDLTDDGFRRWWVRHALTTDTVSGVLVLLVTLLVVDQLVRRRQISDRSRAVAAQAAIMLSQATRSATAMSSMLAGTGERGDAADEVRTYMIVLLVGAPVLMDARVSRNFLELAQHLGGQMAHLLATTGQTPGATAATSSARLDDTVRRLRAASAPLLALLTPGERVAASGDDSG